MMKFDQLSQFIQHNIVWVALALISGTMLLWPMLRRGARSDGLTPSQATMLMNREEAVVIDVRAQAEWDKGHIPNARHLPLDELDQRLQDLAKFKTRPLIISCAGGQRAGSAGARLKKAGFEKVYVLEGGVSAWEQAGLPLAKK